MMYLTEQYHLYHLAHHLMMNEDFQLLHMNSQTDEVWLEKQNRQVSTIIRLVHKGYHWKNHLKTDIATVFHRVTMMMRSLKGKKIEVFNVYITEHEPVDDWETLKKTMILKEKKPVRMNVFYLSESNYQTEQTRLCQKMSVQEPEIGTTNNKTTVQDYKHTFQYILEQKYNDIRTIFTFGKPRLVYMLMAFTIMMYILTGWINDIGMISDNKALEYEWWTLLSSLFLHISLLHLSINLIALYYLGSLIEKIYGSTRFILIFLLAGIGAGIVSHFLHSQILLGNSGALFGLLGALFYFGFTYQKLFIRTIEKPIFFILLLNLAIGLLVLQLDIIAHIAGFLFGFLVAVGLSLPQKKFHILQVVALTGYLLILIGIILFVY